MSNWPLIAGARHETLGFASGTGIALTPANGSKGSYATIGTAGFRYDGFLLSIDPGASSVQMRVDIAINTGGSDVTIVEDLFVDFVGTATSAQAIFIPVKIPSGAVVKARAQSTITTAGSIVLGISAVARDTPAEPAAAKMVSCTDFTGSLPTNTVAQNATSFTAWTTIVASTTNRVKELLLCPTSAGDVSRTASVMVIEIAIGSAGNEKTIGAFMAEQASSSLPAVYAKIPCDIPAGSRISFRCQCATSSTDTIGVAASGVIA